MTVSHNTHFKMRFKGEDVIPQLADSTAHFLGGDGWYTFGLKMVEIVITWDCAWANIKQAVLSIVMWPWGQVLVFLNSVGTRHRSYSAGLKCKTCHNCSIFSTCYHLYKGMKGWFSPSLSLSQPASFWKYDFCYSVLQHKGRVRVK